MDPNCFFQKPRASEKICQNLMISVLLGCFFFNIHKFALCYTLNTRPASVTFCQGRKNITLPSLVDGSNKPMLSGLKYKKTSYV